MSSHSVINLGDLCSLLQRALLVDGLSASGDALMALLKAHLEQQGALHKVVILDGGNEACALHVLYPVYAAWVTAVGVHLGFQCETESRAGEWCSELPNALQVFTTLRSLIMVRLESMEQAQAAARGYSLLDVVEKSVANGESYEQSKARLHSLQVGLVAASPPDRGSSPENH